MAFLSLTDEAYESFKESALSDAEDMYMRLVTVPVFSRVSICFVRTRAVTVLIPWESEMPLIFIQ